MDMDIESLIERINAVAASHAEKNITEDLAARLKLLKAAEDLVAALKPPDMVVADMAFSVFHYASVRLALEMGMFEKLVLAERPLPVTELAASPTADTQLVLRIARSLAATGFLADVQTAEGQDAFTIAAAGRHAIVPSCRAGLKFHFDQNLPVVIHAPEFFRQNGFKIPSTQQDGLFQHVYQTEDDCYTYWFKQPGVMENFNTFMQGYFETIDFVRPISWFPYDQVCFDGFDARSGSKYVYVDVGGGKGHHTQGVLERYPKTTGVFMLQDIPQVIEDIYKTPGIVRGARTYVLDNILHNWNDVMARKILENIKVAMKPKYSKLIVQGIVMPDANVPLLQSGLDLAMLFSHNGVQRNRAQWQGLLEAAGLKIIKIWTPPGMGNAMIEAEVKE